MSGNPLWPLLEVPAAVDPTRRALTYEGRAINFDELRRQAEQVSGLLDGSPIALLDVNSDLSIALMYACMHRGAPFVPLNYRLRPPEIAGILSRRGLGHLVIGTRYRAAAAAVLDEWDGTVTELADLFAEPPAQIGDRTDPVDAGEAGLADLVLFSSGTSKTPKAIGLDGGAMAGFIMGSTPVCAPETRDDSMLMSMPLYHVAGMVAVLRSLFSGRRLVVLDQFAAEKWINTVKESGVTHAFLVPTMLQHILDAPNFVARDLASLKTLTYGGGPMPQRTIEQALAELPETVGLVGVYGLTEASGTVCVLDEQDHAEARAGDALALARLGSVGKPTPDVTIEIRDAAAKVCGPSELGQITITGRRISEGASTRGADGRRILETGDRGYLDEGGYLFFDGREDDMIIRGGENISPIEIEESLGSAKQVDECAVLGMADETWGQIVVAAVTIAPGQELDLDLLREECRGNLAGYKWPDHITAVDELPMSPTGKVIKRELKPLLAVLLSAESAT